MITLIFSYLLKILIAGLLFRLGIALEWWAGAYLMESSKPEVQGAAVALYGCVWTVCLLGGAMMLITGLYLAAHVFS